MVNLAKIRKKAKEKKTAAEPAHVIPSRVDGEESPGTSVGDPSPSARLRMTPDGLSKLEQFKQEAGKRREIKRAQATESAADQIEVLTFVIAGENYAVGIDNIVEIVTPRAITRVPNSDDFIVGIISLRGDVVTLVDVRKRLNHPPVTGESEDRRVVVVEQNGETLGFEVDRVLRVVAVKTDDIEPQPVVDAAEHDESVRGVFRLPNTLTILLDLDTLLTHGTHV